MQLVDVYMRQAVLFLDKVGGVRAKRPRGWPYCTLFTQLEGVVDAMLFTFSHELQ